MSKLNIKLTSQEGVTLHTEGTYCEKSIAVIPHLESITVTPTTEVQNITPSEGYAGIGSVRVEAGSGEARPYFDGTVIIEKAESVLGLRRFKDIMTTINNEPFPYDTTDEEVINPYSFDVEGVIEIFDEIIQVTKMTCLLNVTNALGTGTLYALYFYYNDEWGMVYFEGQGWTFPELNIPFTITSTNGYDEWLLANTEGVSV